MSRLEQVFALLTAGFVLVFLYLTGTASSACAQTLEPRAYVNVPTGMNFLLLGYSYMQGDVLLDPSLPVDDADSQVHSTLLMYSRFLGLCGRSGSIALLLPYAWLSASGTLEATAERRRREVSGLADPALRFAVNLYGAPALSFEEFKNYRQDTIVGVSLLVTAPLGDYDPAKLANIGTNRWTFKPEIGVSQALGRWKLDGMFGITFFTENDDFLGGKTREQDPIYSLQGHVIYEFPRGLWVALNATYYTGGSTTVDGVEIDDLQGNWRLGATLAVPVNRRHSIKLYGSAGAYAP